MNINRISIGTKWHTPIVVCFVAYVTLCHYTYDGDTRPFAGYLLWLFKGFSGALLSMAVAKVLPDSGFKWLQWIGGMSMGIMLIHKFPLVALQEHIPLIKVMFGKDVNVAFMGVLLVFVGSVASSIFATLAFRRVIPWSIGERKWTA